MRLRLTHPRLFYHHIAQHDARQERLHALGVVDLARGTDDGGELGAAIEEEVVAAVALLLGAGEQRADGAEETGNELRHTR